MKRVAINGFGRIGRAVTRVLLQKFPDIEIVAINDLAPNETLLHLMKYDTIMGKYREDLFLEGDTLHTQGQKIQLLEERNPSQLPWKSLQIDCVLECTGIFTTKDKAKQHVDAGAKKVILSAPPKDTWDKMIVMGVNDDLLENKDTFISNASCTTNCLAHVAKVIHENFTIENSYMTTVHAYTNDQNVLDVAHSDLRRARAAGQNIIPTTTGAASAVAKVLPALKGKIDGSAIRVPVANGSLVDFHAVIKKPVSVDSINAAFMRYADQNPNYMSVCSDPIVSSDIIGMSQSSIVDQELTYCQDNLIRVVAWYDNEWGYSNRLAELCHKTFEL
ncbi:MAG TPA: type I glyceraldehyde-3-phosphate dehydrogenase [Oligoflexia bacterium]|nr:type I glyceraldehyde-3-phosphate dehydrogenase [Oligoflexia bacterium]HMR24016.1 type I glyceraldehyde-3-phosphate dehydrogenase [Oligoflexia bacterium]